MSTAKQGKESIRADKWALARLFDVHASSIHSWQKHEGLGVALVSPGAPGRPALFDGRLAIEWFRSAKRHHSGTAPTLKDLETLLKNGGTR